MNSVCDADIYRHCEELYPYTLLIRNHLPYNSVAIYHC